MSEWKYIDSIVELSDFECAHCDTRDFCMVVCDTIDEPWETLTNFLKKNQTVVEQCSFNKDEIIPLLKSLETASGGVGGSGSASGLGYFGSYGGVSFADSTVGFLGCATREIAQHFGLTRRVIQGIRKKDS